MHVPKAWDYSSSCTFIFLKAICWVNEAQSYLIEELQKQFGACPYASTRLMFRGYQ